MTTLFFVVIVIVIQTDLQESTMADQQTCGPEVDRDFFNDLQAVFDKFPDAAQKYSIRCAGAENEKILSILGKDPMQLDFQRRVGNYLIKGHKVITEFEEVDDAEPRAHGFHRCCERDDGNCVEWCQE